MSAMPWAGALALFFGPVPLAFPFNEVLPQKGSLTVET